jgi:hypothetical protein
MTFVEAYIEFQKTFAVHAPEIVDTTLGDFVFPLEMVDQPEQKAGAAQSHASERSQTLRGFTVSPLPPMLGRDWNEIVAGGFPIAEASADAVRAIAPEGRVPRLQPEHGNALDPTCDFLLRFFDVTVQEGKTYQYRVAVQVENPNFRLPSVLLKDAQLAREELRDSAFSHPTGPVEVVLPPAEVVAGPVHSTRAKFGGGESASLVLLQHEPVGGALVGHVFHRMEAGQVLNFKAENVKHERAVGGLAERPLPSLHFRAGALLVDLRGDPGSGGELLLLGADGRLATRCEFPPLKRRPLIEENNPVVPARPAIPRNPASLYSSELKRL